MIVEALTDNRNRTASDVRHTFAKFGGNLGTTGAVAWQFERRGVVIVPADGVDEDELFLAAADAGADDLEQDGDVFQVDERARELSAVRQAIEAAGFTRRLGRALARAEDDRRRRRRGEGQQLMRLIDALEDNDDVQDVYANFDIPEAVLEAVAG